MTDMIYKQSPLSFRVECTGCHGMETWTLGRISRLLTTAGRLPLTSASDIEFIAEQFIAYHKHIACPGCNKTNVLIVRRIQLDT